MTLAELLQITTVDNPITLSTFNPDGNKREPFFSGFAMDVGHKSVTNYGVMNPEEWEVVEVFSRLLDEDDLRYCDCYTDELHITVKPILPAETESEPDKTTSFLTECFDKSARLALAQTDGWLYCGNEAWKKLREQTIAEFVAKFKEVFGEEMQR